MGDKDQWYSNKDLSEQINEFKEEFAVLRTEMRETRTIIKKYNGLREKVEKVNAEVGVLKAKADERSSVFDSIRQWGGWIIALITLILLFYQTF